MCRGSRKASRNWTRESKSRSRLKLSSGAHSEKIRFNFIPKSIISALVVKVKLQRKRVEKLNKELFSLSRLLECKIISYH